MLHLQLPWRTWALGITPTTHQRMPDSMRCYAQAAPEVPPLQYVQCNITALCYLTTQASSSHTLTCCKSHPPPHPCRATLNLVLESFCQTGELVAAHPGPVLECLLPALCEVVLSPSEGAEGRFFSLRMISDVLHHLLYDPQLYGSVGPAGAHALLMMRLLLPAARPLLPLSTRG
jgi:hypothetical protein